MFLQKRREDQFKAIYMQIFLFSQLTQKVMFPAAGRGRSPRFIAKQDAPARLTAQKMSPVMEKWWQKWGDGANELLIIRLRAPLLEISFNNNNLKVQRQVFFSTDNCYLRWFRTLLVRQTENKDWHATKGPCRDWIRDVVATEHMSRPREHQLASLNFCYLALFSVRTVPSFLCMLLLSCTFFIIQIFDIKGVSLHMDGVVWEDSIAT